MKFTEYKYVRPDFNEIKVKMNELTDIIKNSDNFDDIIKAIDEVNVIKCDFETMQSLAQIRFTINSFDEFYDKENNYFDETLAYYSELLNNYNIALVNCKFVNELKDKYGTHLFDMIKLELECFSPDIIPELQEESKLVSEHNKLIASAKIEFDGKVLNLSQMAPYTQNKDRNIRKEAETATWKFFEDNEKEFDRIYDNLVKVRTRMAKKLGYSNYIELGYKRLGRSEYNQYDVKKYRDQVLKEITPIATKIFEDQALRIGVKDFKSYDFGFTFPSGNPTPKGELEEKLASARKMYHEMSEETKEFVDFMLDHENIDLLAKPGKQGGGYCTYISNYKSPFVFANFNGTSHDVNVLTHEFGHAFQVYSSRNYEVLEYMWPTLEACEIHSMSMEFFTWPWMDLFFKEDTLKYKYFHLADSITFIPYGVTVDEFQHRIYENPDMTPDERKSVWREIEKKYMPYKKYDNKFLDKGTWWLRQSHIFETAFYYIDYTLAQNCAHQFFVKNMENPKEAWNDYVRLCKAGGSKSFLELLKVANLSNPFIDGTLKKVSIPLKAWLDKVDATKL